MKNSPGDKYNYWTLIRQTATGKHIKWLARCICGKEKEVYLGHLKSGKSISCSCIGRRTHGKTNTPTYRSWSSMVQRCTNINNDRYTSYGGRGIKIDPFWESSFEHFLQDMGERPSNTSLDRIDVDGDYTKDNCRWATRQEQQRNRRDSKRYGKSIIALAEEYNIAYSVLQTRLKRGWDLQTALTTGNVQGQKGFNANA